MNEKHQFTSEGLENIKADLKRLKEVERPRNVEALKEARAQGDLSENAEYDAARDEQARIEKDIAELEEIIKNSVVIDDEVHTSNIGKLISIVYENLNESYEFVLVSNAKEVNPMENRISKDSPLGKAVYEANIGARVIVKLDSGAELPILVKNIRSAK